VKRPARMPRRARRNESAPSFQPLSIYTPQFKRWFGDSKVVDAQGRPLVVYHGGEKMGFTAFDPKRRPFDFDTTRAPFFFSDRAEVACSYVGEHAEVFPGQAEAQGFYKVYLSIQKPLVADAKGAQWDELDFPANSLVARVIRGVQRSAVQPDGAFYGSTNEVAFYAAQAGYDGVILHNVRDYGPFSSECGAGDQPATVYIAFKANQIKSVHNQGAFSPDTTDLRYNPRRARRNPSCKRPTYWGRGGAGMMFVCTEDATVLLLLRASWVMQGGTWGVAGGGLEEGHYNTPIEDPILDDARYLKAALKETEEECGSLPPGFRASQVVGQTEYEDCGFRYVTFIADLTKAQKDAWHLESHDDETDEFRWVPVARVKPGAVIGDHALHFGVEFTTGQPDYARVWQGKARAVANPHLRQVVAHVAGKGRRARRNEGAVRTPVTSSPAFQRWFGRSVVTDKRGRPLKVYHGTTKGGFTEFRRDMQNKPGFFFTDSKSLASTYVAGSRKKDALAGGFKTFRELQSYALQPGSPLSVEVVDGEYELSWDTDSIGTYSRDDAGRETALRDVNRIGAPGIYTVYLRLENPLIVDAEGQGWSAIDAQGLRVLRGSWRRKPKQTDTSTDELSRYAEENGYDGLIVKNVFDEGDNSREGASSETIYVVFDPRQIKSADHNIGTFSLSSADLRHNPRRARRNPTVKPTETPAFQRWFGASKVVTPSGRPKKVYHGSERAGFAAFDEYTRAHYFSDKPKVAATYTKTGDASDDPKAYTLRSIQTGVKKPGLYEVYLRMERPLVVDAEGAEYHEIPYSGVPLNPDDVRRVLGRTHYKGQDWSTDLVTVVAQRLGYDGVIFKHLRDEVGGDWYEDLPPSTVYAVFDPKQIKSANFNEGTFDPKDPDIRKNPRRKPRRPRSR